MFVQGERAEQRVRGKSTSLSGCSQSVADQDRETHPPSLLFGPSFPFSTVITWQCSVPCEVLCASLELRPCSSLWDLLNLSLWAAVLGPIPTLFSPTVLCATHGGQEGG